MIKHKNTNLLAILVPIIIASIIAVLGFSIYGSFNDTTYTITVTDKERIIDRNGDSVDSKYLIFGDTTEGESLVFENTDELFRGKFNSSNMQGKLKEGHTYEVTVVGWRIPFLSQYQNIIEVEEVK